MKVIVLDSLLEGGAAARSDAQGGALWELRPSIAPPVEPSSMVDLDEPDGDDVSDVTGRRPATLPILG
jgi:hypothetical protein